MYRYSDQELAALSALAESKGVPGVLVHFEFVPDGAEDEEDHVSVISRRFSPAELATWVDAPDTVTSARNVCVQLILSIDGAAPPLSGRGSIVWLGDLLDGALQAIARAAGRPLGLYADPADISEVRIGRKTTPEDLARLGLPGGIVGLRQQYPDPGQLRGVKAGEAPAFIVRRPSLDEFSVLAKGGAKHAALVDLLLECIVEPAPIEQRRAIIERFPGLGLTCLPILQGMRAAGAPIEKKDKPRAGLK